jgi:two-component system sensor histidine kinase/response regulator
MTRNHRPSRMNILVVDDVPQNLLAMRALLQEDDTQVHTAESGQAALELLLAHDFALALLDVQMPAMDGYALAETMRGSERTRHVPIIFITAGATDEQRTFRGYEAGAVDFLYKPVDRHVLRSKVAVFADLHRQRVLLAERMAELQRLMSVNSLMQSALTHDIRAPLAALNLNAELLLRRADAPWLQQAGARVKAATAMLGRQVDHLVNLGRLPDADDDLRPATSPGAFDDLVAQRVEAAKRQGLVAIAPTLEVHGDTQGEFDPALLADALDHLLLQAATHAGDAPIRLELNGESRRSLQLRIGFDAVLGDAAAHHMFGAGVAVEGVAAPRVGTGLAHAERIVRAHGGSLIGRSREREGTQFELVLPRGGAAVSGFGGAV